MVVSTSRRAAQIFEGGEGQRRNAALLGFQLLRVSAVVDDRACSDTLGVRGQTAQDAHRVFDQITHVDQSTTAPAIDAGTAEDQLLKASASGG